MLLDPTLLVLERGRQWLDRYGNVLAEKLFAPATLRHKMTSGDLSPWYRPFYGQAWSHPLDTKFLETVGRVQSTPPFDAVSTSLTAADQLVVADIWEGLKQGHLLALRRTPTLDALIQADVRLDVSAMEYARALRLADDELGTEAASALDRRVRFLARLSDLTARPTLVVGDSGISTYR